MMAQWQKELQEGFRDRDSLLKYLNLDSSKIDSLFPFKTNPIFGLKVPISFVNKMEKENPFDPLLLQILPQSQELKDAPHFTHDAVGDLLSLKSKGLIQKYHGRILLIMTGACAVHCRYCFRQHFPYKENTLNQSSKETLFNILRNDSTIEEIIFSGGDPLLLSNDSLLNWVRDLKSFPQIKRWRVHSRLLSVLPSRFDEELISLFNEFQSKKQKVILVNHFNHPNEIDEDVIHSTQLIHKSGLTLLNQSVLLKGINDNSRVLKNLNLKLFDIGIMPYYLHLLDRTQGTQHFEVKESQAHQIYHELSSQLPGYLVPKLVREESGKPYKSLMTTSKSYSSSR